MVTVELLEDRLVRCGDTKYNLAQGTRFEFQFQYLLSRHGKWNAKIMCVVTNNTLFKGEAFHINKKYLKKVED